MSTIGRNSNQNQYVLSTCTYSLFFIHAGVEWVCKIDILKKEETIGGWILDFIINMKIYVLGGIEKVIPDSLIS